MPGSRHSHRILLLIAAGIMVAMVAGCYQEPQQPRRFAPGEPLYDHYTTSGDRLVVRGGDGQPWLKLRQRRRSIRVYGPDMIFVGQLRTDEIPVALDTLDGQPDRSVEWIDDDTAMLSGLWRADRFGDRGWEIFDDRGRLIAQWRRDDDQRWIMRLYGPDFIDRFVVESIDGRRHIKNRSLQTVATVADDDRSDLEILAWAIEPLCPLGRAALSTWAGRPKNTEAL